MSSNFASVTETPGDVASEEQIARAYRRYAWAASYVVGQDVLEVGCGTGIGLGLVASVAKSVMAGDISETLLEAARKHYGCRVTFQILDAMAIDALPMAFDLILLFEAIYYLSDANAFVSSCKKILRQNGKVLIVTANKDLYDFNPSPYATRYFGIPELQRLFAMHGFETKFFGSDPVTEAGVWQRMLRPVKRFAVAARLIPQTMQGKRLLKRLVFGRLSPMPNEFLPHERAYVPPQPILACEPNTEYKVLYCVATLAG